MVCIAAFIILSLIGIFVLIISIWNKELGKKYLKVFKKAWGCVGKRLTLRKCDTNFKDDIKNSILKKVIIKKPKLVKPISFLIEVLAVLIVFVTVFSLVEATKAGLSLYALGTCNVSNPDSCILGNFDSCPIDSEELSWFQEWGVIFDSIPDRIKKWDASEFVGDNSIYYQEYDQNKEIAIDIFDPLCSKCIISFNNQLEDGFFDKYNVAIIPYSVKGASKEYRFNNSYLISSFLLAVSEVPMNSEISPSWLLVKKLATAMYDQEYTWQYAFTFDEITESDVFEVMQNWLQDIGYSDEDIDKIVNLVKSPRIKDKMLENEKTIEEQIHLRGVPTTIYNGKKHTGVYNK